MVELMHANTLTLAFGLPGHTEWIVILIIGLLIFGRRLPEVGRSLGRGIVEFKRGIKGIEDDIEEESEAKPKVAGKPKPSLPKDEADDEPAVQAPAKEKEHANVD